MKIIKEDIWKVECDAIIIPTNCQVRKDGTAVMGAGLAKQAADRYPTLSQQYGMCLHSFKTKPILLSPLDIYGRTRKNLLLFPTKIHWKDLSSLDLILENAYYFIDNFPDHINNIALPKLGCGLGGLDWETQVRPMLENILDDRFYACV